MDKYRQWLVEQVEYWRRNCLESAASYGYPDKIKFAEQYMRENLDAYEQCLTVYDELQTPGSLIDRDATLTADEQAHADALAGEEFLRTPNAALCPQCDGDGYVIVGWDEEVYENIKGVCSYCAGSGYKGM